MSKDLMSRLRGANPAPVSGVSDKRLAQRILASTPTWAAWDQVTPAGSVMGSRQRLKRSSAGGAVVLVALAAVLIISLTGRSPSIALAFPVLNRSSTITPAELSRSLRYYGVAPDNDGIDIRHGHAVSTRWGTGYVLTNAARSAICVVAPGLTPADWGAACATQGQAASTGMFYEYADDPVRDSARLIGLFPRGAVVTQEAREDVLHRVRLHNGVLAINVRRPEELVVTIAHHTTVARLVPSAAHPAYGPVGGSSSSVSTTASAATAH